ncbi:unnamed protein product [Polarella glacialis]|uniref:Tubulin--tyrosine ligase-like protein 9 n=1 Tax=Polarella glacialis TaxID=89957 RepID=A0A813F504_POLGL|nr:unnamed protein product [Polarella glacialis]
MLYTCLPEALAVARRGDQCGSVKEINSKRLLALNLRKLGGGEFHFTPRSYVLVTDSLGHEFVDFVHDFKASQAFAILKYVSNDQSGCAGLPCSTRVEPPNLQLPEGTFGRELPDISWEPGPDPTRGVTTDMVRTSVAVAERAIEVFHQGGRISSVVVTDEEWTVLHDFSPHASPNGLDVAAYAPQAVQLLAALPPECQVTLLEQNLWILKPSLNGGGNGRGIALVDRLPSSPSQLLSWAAAVGRGGGGGVNDALDGCLLQKLVERPHLLDQLLLQDSAVSHTFQDVEQRWAVATQAVAEDVPRVQPNPFANVGGIGLFKYNLRLWILASMASPPEVWLYRDSYVDLAATEFTADLNIASHVTNLQRGHRACQRYWALPDFSAYLRRMHGGRDLYGEQILPQARAIICNVFRALQRPPNSLLNKPVARLKRLGVDVLVDANHAVWLVEFNVLRNDYGLKAAKGQEAKDDLTRRLVEEETKLKAALESGNCIPPTWELVSDSMLHPVLD